MESNNKMRYISAMDVSYKDGIERPFIEIGQIVWVADNSGVKKVKISKWLTQSVYLVKVVSVRLGYEEKIPIGTELCGVLVDLQILVTIVVIKSVYLKHIIYFQIILEVIKCLRIFMEVQLPLEMI